MEKIQKEIIKLAYFTGGRNAMYAAEIAMLDMNMDELKAYKKKLEKMKKWEG